MGWGTVRLAVTRKALTLYHQGEFDKAEKLQHELVENAYYELSYPDTITNLNNLAATLDS